MGIHLHVHVHVVQEENEILNLDFHTALDGESTNVNFINKHADQYVQFC